MMESKPVKGLFIGLNTIDMQFIVEKYPGENQKAKATDYGLHTGGPATNAAITFAHLGGDSHLVSSFGQHSFTQLVYDDLHKRKVETTDLTPERSCHPVFASVITTKTTGKRSIVSYHPDYHNYCDITLDNFPIGPFNIILADSFYIDAALELIKKVNKKIPVVLDGGSWKEGLEKLLPYVDIAICSFDFYPPGTSNSGEVISFLREQGITKIAITHGSKPILVRDNQDVYELPIEKIIAVDTLGAGDVFHGSFCYYYAQTQDFKTSLVNASKVAAQSCKHYGTRSWME